MSVPPFCGAAPCAYIDRSAIRHNLRWLTQRLHRRYASNDRSSCTRPKIWVVMKANAYGHGLDLALPALADADGVCVSSLDDVLRVRVAGWRKPILVLSIWGVSWRDFTDISVGDNLHIVIDDERQLQELEQMAAHGAWRRDLRLTAWLRHAGELRSQGFSDEPYRLAFERLRILRDTGVLAGVGHLQHYAASEDPVRLERERRAFAALTRPLGGPTCTGNSGALCLPNLGDMHASPHGSCTEANHWLRCGLLLYGASAIPGITGEGLGLRPAMSFRARLLSIRHILKGQSVGYGDSFIASQDTYIGTVGAGYGHGVPRRLWQHGTVLAGHDGRSVPLAGRVAMDSLTIDLGPDPIERIGDTITLWGRAPGGAIQSVEAVASACDTIAAELLTGLTDRTALLDSES